MTKYVSPVDYSIAGEKALGLGVSGRRVAATLEALRRFDARAPNARDPAERERLVADAAEACWGYIVQREIIGLGAEDADYVIREYAVPDDVRRALGPKARGRRPGAQR